MGRFFIYFRRTLLWISDFLYFCNTVFAVIAQLVEHRLPKPRVTGSSPAYRSRGVVQGRFALHIFLYGENPWPSSPLSGVGGVNKKSRLLVLARVSSPAYRSLSFNLTRIGKGLTPWPSPPLPGVGGVNKIHGTLVLARVSSPAYRSNEMNSPFIEGLFVLLIVIKGLNKWPSPPLPGVGGVNKNSRHTRACTSFESRLPLAYNLSLTHL